MEPRPFAFHKMEALVKKMQDPEDGVPVRSQKIFLTSIPSAFIGYDLIEWLMEHLNIEESGEAVHLANQLCQYGYFFPVTDCKNLSVKDDNSLYRFQAAYYWPWHHRNPDNVEYAIYLVKRTLRNKQRHALEEYELEALNSLKKNLQNKWDLVTMQAEEQVKVGKERKKMDKLVADSQERAYWRVHRPPPGCQPALEPGPIATLRKNTVPPLHNTELEIIRRQGSRSRVKASQAVEGLVSFSSTYSEYDPFISQVQPSNPWLSDDPSFWQFNQALVEVPTEKRVKRWALSFEDLLADPTGVEEFTSYLRKEYSHENIRFWLAVKELRHCAQSQVVSKVNSIYQEFLATGAPCEINIDSKTQEMTFLEMKTPSRFTFDSAAHHVYTVLLNKDCYPRFIRSEHYKNLLANAIHPPPKKRFFGFGGGGKKKSGAGPVAAVTVTKRRGSDRSLTGIVHDTPSFSPQTHVPLSTSQSNLHDITLSRDGGLSPERMSMHYKNTKAHSVERKQSSDDERAAQEGSTSKHEPRTSTSSEPCQDTKRELKCEDAPRPVSEIQRKLSNCNLFSDSPSSETPSPVHVIVPTVEAYPKDSPSPIQPELIPECHKVSTECLEIEVKECHETPPETQEEEAAPIEIIVPSESCLPQATEPLSAPVSPHRVEPSKSPNKEPRRVLKTQKSKSASESGKQGCGPNNEEPKEQQLRVVSPFEKGSSTSLEEEASTVKTATDPQDGFSEKVRPSVNTQNPTDICPWEDEESCKTEEPFVKKYATLGYL